MMNKKENNFNFYCLYQLKDKYLNHEKIIYNLSLRFSLIKIILKDEGSIL